jgi:hypothetical protein
VLEKLVTEQVGVFSSLASTTRRFELAPYQVLRMLLTPGVGNGAQTLVKHNTLYTLPEPVEGGLELASPSKKSPKKHARGVEPDEHTVPHAGAEEAQTPLCMYHAGEKVKDRLSLEKAQVRLLDWS